MLKVFKRSSEKGAYVSVSSEMLAGKCHVARVVTVPTGDSGLNFTW